MRYTVILVFILCLPLHSETNPTTTATPSTEKVAPAEGATSEDIYEQEEDKIVNFEGEEGFIDLSDALRSKHFVRRAILNTAIKNSSRFHLGRPYINHLVGFNAILQMPRAKMMTAMQALSAGYVLPFGLGIEGGLDFSSISHAYVGTRFLFDQLSTFVWPFAGLGLSRQIDFLSVSDGARELREYAGSTSAYFVNFGLMIPLVDIGLKAEGRLSIYGSDRLMITTGLGAVLFL